MADGKIYKAISYFLFISIIIYILYYAYCCFSQNQESYFLGDTIRDDTSHGDKDFVENSITALKEKQKNNLLHLNDI